MSFAAIAEFLRRPRSRRLVRPWALSAPIVVLLISIPLLRPLRVPDPRLVSDDEQSRLATIQAIVEHHTLAIEGTSFRQTRHKVVATSERGEPFARHYYSDQPPMLAVLLSGPYWIMQRVGLTLDEDPNWAIFWLTVLGVTLPVALSAGLVYRMGRLFELRRPMRATLALGVVVGSGLISYSTVLNAHAPAAALLLVTAACFFHITVHNQPSRAAGWLGFAGLCAALAATIDPPAFIFLLLFVGVVLAFRWRAATRLGGVLLYCLGAALPMALHAKLVGPITGDLRPGFLHPELAANVQGRGNDSMEGRGADGRGADGRGADGRGDAGTRGRGDSLKETIVARRTQTAPLAQQSPGTPSLGSLPTTSPASATVSASTSPLLSTTLDDDDDDAPPTFWRRTLRVTQRLWSAFFGWHGILSHFPVLLLGILGVTMIMHRHWPAAAKTLAGATLGGGLAIIVVYALCRTSTRDAMFATRWFVVFLPLTLFWSGAWLRRPHRRSSWMLAGVLFCFSVAASLIGATGPLPRAGFDRYTVAGAWHNFTHPAPPPPVMSPLAAGDGEDAVSP